MIPGCVLANKGAVHMHTSVGLGQTLRRAFARSAGGVHTLHFKVVSARRIERRQFKVVYLFSPAEKPVDSVIF